MSIYRKHLIVALAVAAASASAMEVPTKQRVVVTRRDDPPPPKDFGPKRHTYARNLQARLNAKRVPGRGRGRR